MTAQQAAELLETLAERIGECAAVVRLDGPPHIARLAHDLWEQASSIAAEAVLYVLAPERMTGAPFEHAVFYDKAVTTFAEEASAYLNTGRLPRWRLRTRLARRGRPIRLSDGRTAPGE
ncbi:hypothetical protein [Streptomyces fuscigenes]|uniref:hypothetical protein n=1 Tax=Streptomyces fuscigenes TaxID=1528880 RepID=UPI001F460591|nr:hypothetical protein [Streptomyces fuscigenes]MCF3960283.1 hypothetical protein [Streptomyces fuscigenes]